MYARSFDGTCPVCEAPAEFRATSDDIVPPDRIALWFRNDLRCTKCKSPPRERALMYMLGKLRPGWRNLSIHESSPGGWAASAKIRNEAPHYVPSHYDPGNVFGHKNSDGWQNEDLENQTFGDEIFDIVLTQDVFEHLFHPGRAIREIARTLKPGGLCLMTVPVVDANGPTRRRAVLEKGAVRHLLPEQYHGNPVGDGRSLVTIDWSYAIGPYLSQASGMPFAVVVIDDMEMGIRDPCNVVLVGQKVPLPDID